MHHLRGGTQNANSEGEHIVFIPKINDNQDDEQLVQDPTFEVDKSVPAKSDNDEVFQDSESDFHPNYPPFLKWTKDHPLEQILGNPQTGVLTRSQLKQQHVLRLLHA